MATIASQRTQIALDRYVLETLMPDLVGHDRQPSAFVVYLCLWTLSDGGARAVEVSLARLSERTGLSRRGIQDALDRLTRRGLVDSERDGLTAVPRYTLRMPWRRLAS